MRNLTSITVTDRLGNDYTKQVLELFGIEIGEPVNVDEAGWITPVNPDQGPEEFTSYRAELLGLIGEWAANQTDRGLHFEFEPGAEGYCFAEYNPSTGRVLAYYLGVDQDYGATLYGLCNTLELTVHVETEEPRIVEGRAPMFEVKLEPKVGKFATCAQFLEPESEALVGISVSAGWSTTTEGVKLLMVDTDPDVGPLRILLNDGTVYDANPDN